MTDGQVFMLMVLVVWPLASWAHWIHKRRRHEELRLWSQRWGKRTAPPPAMHRVT